MELLQGKIALVTGASRGIGLAMAQVFLENGAAVMMTGARAGIFEAAAVLERDFPGREAALQLDLGDSGQAARAVQAAVEAFGGLDILVNNAGIHLPRPFLDFPQEDFEQVFRVNVFGTFAISQAAARQMVKQGRGGSIIHMASASAKKADPQGAAYNSTKSALVGLARVMALELGRYNIRVNTILPGATDTDMIRGLFEKEPGLKDVLAERTPLGRMAAPRDQANAALFLASELAAHITGEQLVVSGGEFMET